jgi:hypothetical protein
MASPERSSFRLRKWYLDVIAEDGSAIVGYWARLQWGPVRLHFASLLRGSCGGEPVLRHTLQRCPPPRLDGGTCSWSCPPLGVAGRWTALAAPLQKVLLATGSGGIRWTCAQPAASARLCIKARDGAATTLRGLGYVEVLDLTLPPWRLPFNTLWWGHFIGPDASLVWLQWQGASCRRLALLDGTLHGGPRITADGVVLEGAAALELGRHTELRAAPLGTGALRALPGLVTLLPRRFRDAHENKRLSQGTLHRAGREPVRGWAIHEVVQW